MPPTIRVRFDFDEPSFNTFEEAVAYTSRNSLQPEARALTARLRDRLIVAARYDDDHLFISLDDASILHFSLSVERVLFELLAPDDPRSQAAGRCDVPAHCTLLSDESSRHFEWKRDTIAGRLQNRRLHSLTPFRSSVALDIGNAVALHMTRMFVVELERDVLYFEFDVDSNWWGAKAAT